MRLDSIALAAVTLAAGAAPVMHVDADGDGFLDSVALQRAHLHVATRTSVLTARVPRNATLDGAMRVRGLAGTLLLVRFGSRLAVTDAVYRVTAGAIERVHVRGTASDALVRGGGTGAFADFDCGRAPLTVDQISARPNGGRWDETVLTYGLSTRGLVLQRVRRITISGQAASTRRCALLGR
jgi:hypothetical protein